MVDTERGTTEVRRCRMQRQPCRLTDFAVEKYFVEIRREVEGRLVVAVVVQ